MHSANHSHLHTSRGFTLIEMLITIALIGILTALILFKYGSFNSAVLLKSQVYEMALNIREAQVFAISVRTESEEPSTFRSAYGIQFDLDTPNTYFLFLDANDNSPPSEGQIGDPFTIDPRFYISRICVNECATDVESLTVSFKRPDFDAQLFASGYGAVSSAEVVVSAVADDSVARSVLINSTGQISVQ